MLLSWCFFFTGVVLSIFASSTESAFINVSMGRLLKHEAADGLRWGGIRRLKETPEQLYGTILAVNTLGNMMVSSFGAKLLVHYTLLGNLQERGARGEGAAAAVMTITIGLGAFLFLELLPKMYGTFHFERLLPKAGPLLGQLVRVARYPLAPLVAFPRLLTGNRESTAFSRASLVSEEDLIQMMELGRKEGSFREHDVTVLKNIFASSEVEAEDIMVPRINMQTVHAEATVRDAVALFTQKGVSRLPVRGGDIDDMVGVLYAKDLLSHKHLDLDKPVRHYMRPGIYLIPETKKVLDLLAEFRNRNIQIAVVVDEYGGTVGLLTLEDVLEEIVGEIFDEHDVVKPLFVRLAGGQTRYQAGFDLEAFAEHCDLVTEKDMEDYDTVGGWLSGRIGHLPSPGEVWREGGYQFIVESVANQRIQRLLMRRDDAPMG